MKYSINDTTLTAIGNAIREKNGSSDTYKPTEMASAISAITTGGGGGLEPIVLTGDCQYACGGSIFTSVYGKVDISTKDVLNTKYMFNNCTLPEVDFDINVAYDGNSSLILSYMFNQSKMLRPPYIRGDRAPQTGNYSYYIQMDNMFFNCSKMIEIPYDYFHQFGGDAHWESAKNYTTSRANMFNNCSSLRALPDLSMLVNKSSYTSSFYYKGFNNCYVLDEIVDLPVYENVTWTSNAFNSTFAGDSRLKRLTFATNEDGTPKTASGWKSQTIDLSGSIGYAQQKYYVTDNTDAHGIGTDKMVTDLFSHAELANDPDWWTNDVTFSRYNHDSAVETINSLPDVSASGGTNTIKFKGTMGSGYGKAISDLTAEEKAVATAKGWTVTIV